MTSKLITADKILSLDEEDQIFSSGYIVVEDGIISEIGESSSSNLPACDEHVDMPHRLLMPGFVNAHTHTPMVLFRGMAEGVSLFTMEGFLQVLRVLEGAADDTMVSAAVEVSCAEMIRTGTTCFADQYFYMDKVLPVVRQSKMRAALAYGIVELGEAEAREREINFVSAFLADLEDDPLLNAWVGPHAFFVDNSLEIIREELELVKKYNTGMHIHFATNTEEEDYCQEHFGTSAVAQMKKLGILDHRLLAAHCIAIPPEEFSTLAESNFTAVICPSAAMRSGTGAAPVLAMKEAGINLALGSDNVVNSNSYDMFNQMQMLANLVSLQEKQPAALTATEILHMATMGGARALGMEDKIGSLEVGKYADMIALDMTGIGWGPTDAQDLYTALVYSISGMHVTDVMVAGNMLLENREWITVDFAQAKATLDKDFQRLKANLSN